MRKEKFRISLGTGELDNDYVFYEDGTIQREYDRNMYRLNETEQVAVSQLSSDITNSLILSCPSKHLDWLKSILHQ